MVTATARTNGNGNKTAEPVINRMTLDSITTGVIRRSPRTLIYGKDGIGKSTFGAEAPKPIFICTEDGAERIDVAKFPLCTEWQDVFDAITTLGRSQHEFKTVVLDSIDWAQNLALQHVVKTEFNNDLGLYKAFGSGNSSLFQEMRKLLMYFDRLHKVKNMEIILIGHSAIRTINNPNGTNYDCYQASLNDSQKTNVWGLVKEWCDIVVFANHKITVRTDSKKAVKGKGIVAGGDNGRMCFVAQSAAYDSKVRAGWNLPAEFPLSYAEFSKYVHGGAQVEESPEEQPEIAQ